MEIILSKGEFTQLSEATRAEILALLSPPDPAASQLGPEFDGLKMDSDRVNLTYEQMQEWMEGAADPTKAGLRVFAEQGPVIRARALTDAGITNLPHFQSRTTIRTRTVTGKKDAFLLGWDDWGRVPEGEGKYAVTPMTHRSLQCYFWDGHITITVPTDKREDFRSARDAAGYPTAHQYVKGLLGNHSGVNMKVNMGATPGKKWEGGISITVPEEGKTEFFAVVKKNGYETPTEYARAVVSEASGVYV